MSAKWTDEQRAKFKRTMAAKRTALAKPKRRRQHPVETAEFARFMAAAWKIYKTGRS